MSCVCSHTHYCPRRLKTATRAQFSYLRVSSPATTSCVQTTQTALHMKQDKSVAIHSTRFQIYTSLIQRIPCIPTRQIGTFIQVHITYVQQKIKCIRHNHNAEQVPYEYITLVETNAILNTDSMPQYNICIRPFRYDATIINMHPVVCTHAQSEEINFDTMHVHAANKHCRQTNTLLTVASYRTLTLHIPAVQ